ncbi:hypothetical protein Msil_1628 [Methylocella silvestris BL2]|uniref:Uncharacterized protein n=1 Tax=Methylocella silvestris (strain DSM 15510 / CIP 108128 / LMG 27833 / NCIMB 13906 / BL2) TaxID=395965 RepID=B8EK36_METSB|nr:hypothetical protein [Methylocella silvestris]ACK50576.1 hypothetical protein Msil_1628 [Methylocella silvestris BL2]
MLGRLIPAAAFGAALFFAAGAVEAKMMQVELVKQQEVTLADGKKATVYVVKMNGHTMVAMPESTIPDALHQQLFKVQ